MYLLSQLRDAMNVQDVPNYLRSIGFHMSEYEVRVGRHCIQSSEIREIILNVNAGTEPLQRDGAYRYVLSDL